MKSLTLRGLRGGLGCTSLLAGLGYALHQLGQRVLLLDLCPENMLRLHLNIPWNSVEGWAQAEWQQSPWQEAAWNVRQDLWMLPYGQLSYAEQQHIAQYLSQQPEYWSDRLASLSSQFDWVLIDQKPAKPLDFVACDLEIRLVQADPACQVLLQQSETSSSPLLVNNFDPLRRLQRDLWLVWQQKHPELIPLPIHADEAVPESLACKAPIGHHAPKSLAAKNLASLAAWCLSQES